MFIVVPTRTRKMGWVVVSSSTSNFFPIVRHAIEELKKSINAMSV